MKIFIGYDNRQLISYHTLEQSILANTTKPVSIHPLILKTLPIDRHGLTPFTYSRFLVPWLCKYEGWALFLDADMMLRTDISELFELADPAFDVMVCKNKLTYEWASLMLFNCPRCRILTPKFVQNEKNLHSIAWSDNDGELPLDWNHLVGYDEPNPNAKNVHFTQGIPCFPETINSEHADEWQKYAKSIMTTLPWAALMGNSVHAKPVLERLKNV